MKVELYIMRCKIDYFEALKEKLESFCQNYGIIVEPKSDRIMYVNVYETAEYVEGRRLIHCVVFIENRFIGDDKVFSFDFLE